MEITFRPFEKAADGDMVKAFLAETKSLSGQGQDDDDKYIDFVAEQQKEDPGSAAMMLLDGEIVGFVQAYQVKEKPELAFLPFDYIVKERRGRGLGAHLMRYAVERLKERGCRRMILDVAPTNEMAIAFYKKHGFRFIKERSGLHMLSRDL